MMTLQNGIYFEFDALETKDPTVIFYLDEEEIDEICVYSAGARKALDIFALARELSALPKNADLHESAYDIIQLHAEAD